MFGLLGLVVAVASLTSFVSAHGRVVNVTTSSGSTYAGYDPAAAERGTSPQQSAAWTASNLGNIFVKPSQFNTSDIICHYNATPGALHIDVAAGDTLNLQWNEWPNSHVGPVLSYIAACNSSCVNVDKTKLQWLRIDELGWLNNTGWDKLGLGGIWASNVLIANNASWLTRIPAGLADGFYVLRHEVIALHVAEQLDGAQAYPQCFNIRISGGGVDTKRLDIGTLGTQLYGERDSGILVNVHKNLTGYAIPGPKLWSGATPVKQLSQKRWATGGRNSW